MKTKLFTLFLALAASVSISAADVLFSETFSTRRASTYIDKVQLDNPAWPYASQWFEGYTGTKGAVEGNQYDNDYDAVASSGVSIRVKKVDNAENNVVGLFFTSSKTADQNYVQFEGALPEIPAGGAFLHFQICSSETDGGDLSTMIVKVNDVAANVPATTLGAKLVSSIVTIPLPAGQMSSLSFAFNNAPSQRFINRFWIDYESLVVSGTYKIGDLYYYLDIDNSTATVVHDDSYANLTTAIIPATVTYGNKTFTVTSIGEYAFRGCSSLTSVTIPNSVTSIGYYAFRDCSSLTSVTIPNSVTSIGYWAFEDCSSLTSVTIGNSVTSIGYNAFQGCSSLTSVTIPNSVTSIGGGAFSSCSSLTSVTIPNSVTSIGNSAFAYCSSLTSVTIPNSVTSIGERAFYNCSSLTSVTIGNSVTSIGNSAFAYCSSLTSVTIPNSVTSIGQEAFSSCSSLTSVTIPNSVTSIGSSTFSGCTGLTSVTMQSETPPALGNNVFGYGVSIYVPCGSLDVYRSADGWSNYASKIGYAPSPYTITTKAENGYIIYNRDYTICDETLLLTAEPDRGFYFVKWADGNTDNPRTIELTQDTTMEAIFDYFLTGKCGKDNVLDWQFNPSNMALEITGKGALSENYTYNYQIESVTIGNEVTLIGQSAFYGCNKLKNIVLGSQIKVLEEYAFYGCSAIETITCYSMRPPTVNNYALNGLDYTTIVYVPADYLNTYKMHDAWGLYDVRPLGAASVETAEFKVTPGETTADVVWPTVASAATYELVIKDKTGAVICTLVFNANGQLTEIAFSAPARDQAAQATGFAFTVTGLNSSTGYDLTLAAKDNNGNVLHTYTESFSTMDYETAIGLVESSTMHGGQKLLRNGQLFILREGKMYNVQGQEVK